MNKKAEGADLLRDEVVYLIIFMVFILGMFFYVSSKMNNASFWEDFYAKEISRAIDSSKPGDEIRIDVTSAVKIADRNKIGYREVFSFNNQEGEVRVVLDAGTGKSFKYFNRVAVEDARTELSEFNVDVVQLVFRIA